MPASKKPRKKYRPPGIKVRPLSIRFDKDVELKLQLIPHDALAKFKAGTQQEPDWHTIAARINLGATLAHHHFGAGDDAHQAMNHALESLRTSWERYQRLGRIGLTGEEYNHLALGLSLTDEMQLQCTRRELDAAMVEVFKQAAILDHPQKLSQVYLDATSPEKTS